MAQDNTKLCDFANTNNNDFIRTPIAPLTDAESCEINAALLNLVMKDPFSGLLMKMPVGVKTDGSRVGGPELCVLAGW